MKEAFLRSLVLLTRMSDENWPLNEVGLILQLPNPHWTRCSTVVIPLDATLLLTFLKFSSWSMND